MDQETREPRRKNNDMVEVQTSSPNEDYREKWVLDSSTDFNGGTPLRSSTGAWKAALFIIAIEFSERLCFFGLAGNMITYLTKVMRKDLGTAAKSVNYWSGVTTMVPLLGSFVADAYTGRFFMIMISSAVYLMGTCLLTLSQFIPSLKPCLVEYSCKHTQTVHETTFFLAIYSISVATGGYRPCLESFGADQFDDDHPGERKKKISYFNWWNFALCWGLVLGVTAIVYMEDYVGWGVAFLSVTCSLTVAIVIFIFGKRYYRYRMPLGSPLKPLLQVVVAAIAKRHLPYPSSSDLLYEVPRTHKFSQGNSLIAHTNKLRCLDKAAIVEGSEYPQTSGTKPHPWRLATVTQVEELKLIINMIPVWLTSLAFGISMSQVTTFFIKQSSTMDRKIGTHFEIPPATIYTLTAIGMIVAVSVYDRLLFPALRRITGNERGITIIQRIGIGMAFSVVSMSVAAIVETRRLKLVHAARVTGRSGAVPMNVFWLAPQFVLFGVCDTFTLIGLQEYFYDQVPESMRSMGIAFYLSVMGVGSFLSGILISALDRITVAASGLSWFGKDINSSRVDKFFWLLAALNLINVVVFVAIARSYSYKKVNRNVAEDHRHLAKGADSEP